MIRKIGFLLLASMTLGLLVGCSGGEVNQTQVEDWQNQGRDPNDTSDPSPAGETDR